MKKLVLILLLSAFTFTVQAKRHYHVPIARKVQIYNCKKVQRIRMKEQLHPYHGWYKQYQHFHERPQKRHFWGLV